MSLWWVSVLAATALAVLLELVRRRARARAQRAAACTELPAGMPPGFQPVVNSAKITFDLRMLIQHRTRLFAERAKSKGLRFKAAVAANVPERIRADQSRIVLVLSSLLDNAVKFTAEGAVCLEVLLTSDANRGRLLRFNVHDTGTGMDAERLSQVLASDSSSSAVSHGLAVSRRLVTLMDGILGAESEPRGGSTFWFCLPLETAEPVLAVRPEHLHKPSEPFTLSTARPLLPKASMPGKRILIVENNPANQVAALWGVRALGYLADVVSGGQEASEAWRRAPYDLVLLDSAIAGRDETVARIRRMETGCIPIVTMSPSDEGHAAVDGHLTKPVCLLELARTLDHWLGAAGPACASEASSDKLSLPV